MNAIQVLKNEHRIIEQVLECLDAICDDAVAKSTLNAADAEKAIDFFRVFADGCHHAKEEDELFPMLERHGFSPSAGPTAVMRAEHNHGRALIASMKQALFLASQGSERAIKIFVDAAGQYIEMLRMHIQKEDHCLFPAAEHALSESDRDVLMDRFDIVESVEAGDGTHDKYLRIADELAEKYHVRKADVGACGCTHGLACSHTHGQPMAAR